MSETTPEEVDQEVVPTPEEVTDESTGADSPADTDTADSQDS